MNDLLQLWEAEAKEWLNKRDLFKDKTKRSICLANSKMLEKNIKAVKLLNL